MSTVNQYDVRLTVDGRNLGTWDKKSGGAIDSEETKYRPGGMAPERSLGGVRTVANVTLERLYELARDHDTIPWLISRVGRGACVVTQQPLDVDGNAYGRPITYQGTLKTVTPPEPDSTANDPSMIAVEISTDGGIA